MADFESPAFDERDRDPAAGRAAEDLPQVRPPSAAFIVQLFLVPAVIVLLIIGVYFTFRQLVSSNNDWQSLVVELHSTNPHRRWRGAHGLAEMLQADVQQTDPSQQLARNPYVATELAGMMDEQLKAGSTNEDDVSQLAFLARTLGWLDSPATVLPVLQRAIGPEQNIEVRKNAIASIALVAGRAADQSRPLPTQPLTNDIIAASSDPVPLVRQMSAYVLGLLPGDESQKHLTFLLEDADENTRVNAAIGLARQKSADGLTVFYEILGNANKTFEPTEDDGENPQQRKQAAEARKFEHLVRLMNSLKAVGEIAGNLSSEQRAKTLGLITPIADGHEDTRIRLEAKQAANALGR